MKTVYKYLVCVKHHYFRLCTQEFLSGSLAMLMSCTRAPVQLHANFIMAPMLWLYLTLCKPVLRQHVGQTGEAMIGFLLRRYSRLEEENPGESVTAFLFLPICRYCAIKRLCIVCVSGVHSSNKIFPYPFRTPFKYLSNNQREALLLQAQRACCLTQPCH